METIDQINEEIAELEGSIRYYQEELYSLEAVLQDAYERKRSYFEDDV